MPSETPVSKYLKALRGFGLDEESMSISGAVYLIGYDSYPVSISGGWGLLFVLRVSTSQDLITLGLPQLEALNNSHWLLPFFSLS